MCYEIEVLAVSTLLVWRFFCQSLFPHLTQTKSYEVEALSGLAFFQNNYLRQIYVIDAKIQKLYKFRVRPTQRLV